MYTDKYISLSRGNAEERVPVVSWSGAWQGSVCVVGVSTLTHVYREFITAPVDVRLLLALNIQSILMLVAQRVSVCSSHSDKCVAKGAV